MTFPFVGRVGDIGSALRPAAPVSRATPAKLGCQIVPIVVALSCFVLGAAAVIALRVALWAPGVWH